MAIDFKKFIKGIVLGNDVDPSKKLQVEVTSSATTATKTTVQASQTANRTIILPDASDTLVGKATTDTLTNKTFDADGTGNSITNIENADIKAAAAIDASKIANGSVSNTEFQYLDGVTSAIQTQFTNASTALTDHLNDTTDAHDASAISNVPTGNLAATDVQNALNELQTDVDARLLKAGDTMTGTLNMGANAVTSSFAPVSGSDLTNKTYVDGIAAGLDPKESVRVATAASVGGSYATTPSNGRFTGAATSVDGVALSVSDRVLIKDQVDQRQNGIYVYTASGEFTRSADMDGSPASEVSGGNFVFVAQGTTQSASGYVLIANGILTLNTDNLVFTQFSGGANSANKALSNLDNPTAINQTLLPGTDNTINLGSASRRYTTGYMQELRDASSTLAQSITARTLYDSAGNASLTYSSATVIGANSKKINNLADSAALDEATNKRSVQSIVKNLIPDGDADGSQILTVYNDSSTTRPVDGTGGTQANLAVSISATAPLVGVNSFLFTKSGSASTQGSGASIPFTIDNAYKAKVMQIEFDYIVNSGTFVAGSQSTESDVIAYIFDVTNSTLIEPSSIKFLSNSSTIADKFIANFQTSATGTSYRLILHCRSTSTTNYSLKLDNIAVKPCEYVFGTPITDWAAWTPTGSWNTNVTYTGFKRRVGSDAEYKINLAITGAVTAANLTVNLPSGEVIDTTKSPNTASNVDWTIGYVSMLDAGTATFVGGVSYNNTTSVQIRALDAASTYVRDVGAVTNTVPTTWANTDQIVIYFKVPISGWSSSVQVSDGYDAREVSLSLSTNAGSIATSAATPVTLTFTTPLFDTVAGWNGSDTYTIRTAGRYKLGGLVVQNAPADAYISFSYRINGGSDVLITQSRGSATGSGVASSFALVSLNAGDTIQFRASTEGTQGISTLRKAFIEKLQAPTTISATEVVVAHYNSNSAQSIPNNSATVINFEDFVDDTHNAVTVGAAWKFTCPTEGRYFVSTGVVFTTQMTTIGSTITLGVRKNSTSQFQKTRSPLVTSGGPYYDVSASGYVKCNAGDTIDVTIFQNDGGARLFTGTATENYISIFRIK